MLHVASTLNERRLKTTSFPQPHYPPSSSLRKVYPPFTSRTNQFAEEEHQMVMLEAQLSNRVSDVIEHPCKDKIFLCGNLHCTI